MPIQKRQYSKLFLTKSFLNHSHTSRHDKTPQKQQSCKIQRCTNFFLVTHFRHLPLQSECHKPSQVSCGMLESLINVFLTNIIIFFFKHVGITRAFYLLTFSTKISRICCKYLLSSGQVVFSSPFHLPKLWYAIWEMLKVESEKEKCWGKKKKKRGQFFPAWPKLVTCSKTCPRHVCIMATLAMCKDGRAMITTATLWRTIGFKKKKKKMFFWFYFSFPLPAVVAHTVILEARGIFTSPIHRHPQG